MRVETDQYGNEYSIYDNSLVNFKMAADRSYALIPEGVTRIADKVFKGCVGLTLVVIPKGVEAIGESAFARCTALTSVVIPDSVISIGRSAFSGCTGLTHIFIPDRVISIGFSVFSGCTGLTSVVIPDGVTSIGGWAFENCIGLTSVVIPEGVTSIGDDAFEGCTALTSVTIPDSVTSIGRWVFKYCSGLTSIIIPDSVTRIGAGAFESCTGLTSVVMPDSVTSIGNSVFSGCTGLTEAVIPDGVTSIGDSAFAGCTGLTSIEIPDRVISIGFSVFSGCTGLTSVVIPDGVTSIGKYAFFQCSSLTSVEIPDRVISIGFSVFSGCTGLTSVVIPDGVTSIGKYAFFQCSSLTSVEIPDRVTSIGESAFFQCSSLTSVEIPDSVTRIGSGAFKWCTGLTIVSLPESVQRVGNLVEAFSGCLDISNIMMPTGEMRASFLTEHPAFAGAVLTGDEYKQCLGSHKMRLYNELLFNEYWPKESDGETERKMFKDLDIGKQCRKVIHYYLKSKGVIEPIILGNDIEVVKAVMTCLNYRSRGVSDRALYDQLDKVLSLGQMNKAVAQICDDAALALYRKTKTQDSDALMVSDDTRLNMIAYLSTVDLSMPHYEFFQGGVSLWVNNSVDWADCLEALQKVLDSGSDDEKREIQKLFHDVARVQYDHDVHESLRLAAFRGKRVPETIKRMANEAVCSEVDVWYDAEEEHEVTEEHPAHGFFASGAARPDADAIASEGTPQGAPRGP